VKDRLAQLYTNNQIGNSNLGRYNASEPVAMILECAQGIS
jgi:hypothetical protein